MQNLWVKKDVQEQLPGDLEYQKKLFENNIAYAHAAKVFDRSLGTYYGGQQHTRIERAS